MNLNSTHIKGSLFIIALLFSVINNAFSQAPYISGISQTFAAVGDTITISGINFSSTAANNVVKFGAAEGTVISASDKLLSVEVPGGATHDQINVLNTTNNLVGYSRELFYLSFGGSSFDANNTDEFTSQATGGLVTQDLCLCDFDNDGLVDVASTHLGSNFFNVYFNQSTTDNVVLTELSNANFNLGFESFNINCGDLNGDQLPDLVISRTLVEGERIVYLENTSTLGNIDFDPAVAITFDLPQVDPGKISINDMDLDGKPELIIVARAENSIKILKNNSSGGSISFVDPVQTFNVGVDLAGLDVKDLNNDGLPDIAVSSDAGSGFYVLKNSSNPGAGSINFEDPKLFTRSGVQELRIGDINGDGFNDVVLSAPLRDQIYVFPNTTSGVGEEINFGSNNILTGVNGPWGIELVDIDGDADLDIASTIINGGTDNLYVFENTNPGTLTFADTEALTSSSSGNSRNVKSADMDNDGKPDLVFTHKSNDATEGDLAVMLNDNCFTPQIKSDGFTLCTGGDTVLVATNSRAFDGMYEWYRAAPDGMGGHLTPTLVAGATDNFLSITGASAASHEGLYTVKINDLCGNLSDAVEVIVDGSAFVTTGIVPTDPFCQGDQATSLSTAQTGVSYQWNGPDGFSSTDQNPSLVVDDPGGPNDGLTLPGIYTLVMTDLVEGCVSQVYQETVEVISLPSINVINLEQDVFCNNSSIELSLTDFTGYDYSWLKDDVAFADANTTQEITEAGNYQGVISITDGALTCRDTSAVRVINVIDPPTSTFNLEDQKCVGLEVMFESTATSLVDSTIVYTWNFGDTNNSSEENPAHAYGSAGTFSVTLTTNYQYVDACEDVVSAQSSSVTTHDTPTGDDVDILRSQDPDDATNLLTTLEKCPSGSLTLEPVPDALASDGRYAAYDWQRFNEASGLWSTIDNTTSDTRAIIISSRDSIRIELTNAVGCMFVTPGDSVRNLANSGISLDVQSPNQFGTNADTIANFGRYIPLLVDQKFVTLTTDALNPTWTPTDIFEDATLTTIEAYPNSTIEYIEVTGTDSQGCIEKDSVTLTNNRIRADKNFSPNGDGIGDFWQISNSSSSEFGECTISIFDAKGSLVLRQQGPFTEDQVWDGNKSGGGALPEGIYYYVLNCADASLESAGSILLAR